MSVATTTATAQRVSARNTVFVGYAQVGVASELPVQGVMFLLRNDLAQSKVVVTPCLSPAPCEVVETKALEEEYLAAFPVCAVTRSQAKALADSPVAVEEEAVGKRQSEEVLNPPSPPPVDLANTGFAKWCGINQMPVLSRSTVVQEQRQDPTVEGGRCTSQGSYK